MATTGQTSELPVVLGKMARSALPLANRFRALLRSAGRRPDAAGFCRGRLANRSRQQLDEFHVNAAGGSGGYPHVRRRDADIDRAVDSRRRQGAFRISPRATCSAGTSGPCCERCAPATRYPWPCSIRGPMPWRTTLSSDFARPKRWASQSFMARGGRCGNLGGMVNLSTALRVHGYGGAPAKPAKQSSWLVTGDGRNLTAGSRACRGRGSPKVLAGR